MVQWYDTVIDYCEVQGSDPKLITTSVKRYSDAWMEWYHAIHAFCPKEGPMPPPLSEAKGREAFQNLRGRGVFHMLRGRTFDDPEV